MSLPFTRGLKEANMARSRSLLRLLVSILVLAGGPTLHAQLNRGVIEGIVTDPQGAVVPDVEVTIMAVDTNVSQTTKTNSAGAYRAVDLVPGKYRARFVSPSFSQLEISDIE